MSTIRPRISCVRPRTAAGCSRSGTSRIAPAQSTPGSPPAPWSEASVRPAGRNRRFAGGRKRGSVLPLCAEARRNARCAGVAALVRFISEKTCNFHRCLGEGTHLSHHEVSATGSTGDSIPALSKVFPCHIKAERGSAAIVRFQLRGHSSYSAEWVNKPEAGWALAPAERSWL